VAEAFFEISFLFGLAFAKKLSSFLWQTSFTFMIDERLTFYLVIELLTAILFPIVVLFCHNLIRFLFPFI